MWATLGLNIFEEDVQENDHGLRRVKSLSGYLPEPEYADIRWCRLSSPQDALLAADSLARENIFNSFGGLAKACAVWSAPVHKKTDICPSYKEFKILVERAMAQRVWNAVVFEKWVLNLPSWDLSLARRGCFEWPLAIDVGLYRREKNKMSGVVKYDEYHRWIKKEMSAGRLCIQQWDEQKKELPQGGYLIQCQKEWWWISFQNGAKNIARFTTAEWSGDRPDVLLDDVWTSEYIAFSDPSKTPSGYVDPLLNQAMSLAQPKNQDIKKELSDLLKTDSLNDILSYDQQDAIYLATQRLEKKKGFLLADETGYGKGRVLAAIAKIALVKGIKVLFVTEKKGLFSDFYRDCSTVFEINKGQSFPEPYLYHSSAKVLNGEGSVVYKTKTEKEKNKKPDLFKQSHWAWTTYSQFNRGSKTDKFQDVLNWCASSPTWIILDEAQNAAGQSNTGEVIQQLVNAGCGTIFSSATFSKNEEQLSAYRSLFSGNQKDWKRLLSAFVSESNVLRSAITLEWAEQGSFVRREHPPMELPEPLWIKTTPSMSANQHVFAEWWREMLRCAEWVGQAFYRDDRPWSRLGAMMSRASREFSLLQKSSALLDEIDQSRMRNQKVVVVADWTLSSHVVRMIEFAHHQKSKLVLDEMLEDEDAVETKIRETDFLDKPTWKQSWGLVIDDLFPQQEIEQLNSVLKQKIIDSKSKIKEILSQFPEWSVSPFDDLIDTLTKKNISIGEISGRSWKMVQDGQQWKIIPLPEALRPKTVQEFNQGEKDVLLITRAGNSGLSLHAGQNFKDQRQRHMIEWDISPDPSVRLQFWGRVRRKDQVCEPQRSALLIDTPFERRRLNKDTLKQKRLSSHSGKKQSADLNWLGEEGKSIIQEWAGLHASEGRMLGAFYDVDVEKILTRSLILNEHQQHVLVQGLSRGVELFQDLASAKEHSQQWDRPSRSLRHLWWWGVGDKSLYWTERVWSGFKRPGKEMIAEELSKHQQGKSEDLFAVVHQWKQKSWPYENSKGIYGATQKFWENLIQNCKRGMGVAVNDPATGARVPAIILGYVSPESKSAEFWTPSQIGVWLWLSTMEYPIEVSLLALSSPHYLSMSPTGKPASPSWFTGQNFCVSSLVLQGPAWSVAAWGARYSPQGQLMHIQDESGHKSWGWKMPQPWEWRHMLNSERELADIDHLYAFIKTHPHAKHYWRWSGDSIITLTAQSNGFVAAGQAHDIDKILFSWLQKNGHPKVDPKTKNWTWLIPWRFARGFFASWQSSGAIITIDAEHAGWHKKSFPQK